MPVRWLEVYINIIHYQYFLLYSFSISRFSPPTCHHRTSRKEDTIPPPSLRPHLAHTHFASHFTKQRICQLQILGRKHLTHSFSLRQLLHTNYDTLKTHTFASGPTLSVKRSNLYGKLLGLLPGYRKTD